MTDRDQFGPCLRRERERRGISLQDIADRTKIGASLFVALERNDFSRWPGGIYRRAFVRAYAEAIGLDADRTVRDLVRLFPSDEEGNGRHQPPSRVNSPQRHALRLVATNPAPPPPSPVEGPQHRLTMATVQLAVVGSTGAGVGFAIDWFYASLVFAAGALLVAAVNVRRKKKPARSASVATAAPGPTLLHPRATTKRRDGRRPRTRRSGSSRPRP